MSILTNKLENEGLYDYSDPKKFIEYSNVMENFYKNIDEHKPGQDYKVLLVFHYIYCLIRYIVDMISN